HRGAALHMCREALGPTLPVIAQIDGEWVTVTEFQESPWRLLVTRGVNGTTSATHTKGAELHFVESRPIYVFASAPPGCRYPDNAVVQVRLNGVAQTPPAIVRLQDDRRVAGARFVTLEFDLTRGFGGAAAPPAPQSPLFPAPHPAARWRPRVRRRRAGRGAARSRPAGAPRRVHDGSPGPRRYAGGSL